MEAKEFLVEQVNIADSIGMLKETVVGVFVFLGVASALILGAFVLGLLYKRYIKGDRWK